MEREMSVEIDATPDEVWEFFSEYDKHFKEVSPDHIRRVITFDLEKLRIGFYFQQRSPLSGKVQTIRGRITRFEMDRGNNTRRVEYRFMFPYSLVLPRIEQVVEPKGDGTITTAICHFRLGRLLEIVAGKKIDDAMDHIGEELESMKRLLEAGSVE